MVRRDQDGVAVLEFLAPQPRDRSIRLEQALRREFPERHDDLRLDDVDLPQEKRLALDHFVGLRIAIAGWATLQDVRDENVLAPEANRLDDLRQQLAGAADERLTLNV